MPTNLVRGKPYFDWTDQINEWIKQKVYTEVEALLLEIVSFIEKYDSRDGVAPFYYEKLAQIYSKQKRKSDEITILERFSKQNHAPGVKPRKLLERLDKLKI